MGKARQRKETGKLYLDFFDQGLQLRLKARQPNETRGQRLAKAEAKVLLDDFDYVEFFLGSISKAVAVIIACDSFSHEE
ncbi:hypothetical protein HHSLTHF2_04430 [Vreelandella venusta]|uniref:Uncharacterized protein n=1 Tax=Halomonas hydrothermalis TaxID=115561 RepID=A0A6F8U0T3_9GAMM|nr:hypothetical protein [Halomonas hydrothermalis]BCB06553.1 hypothetical protein HHSLTHF2_04430 [Halomonas hydrothermalis]